MTRPGLGASRVLHLDGLRGIAIATVFAVHWARNQVPVFSGGYIGVDVFFVLSGYIITTLLIRREPTYRSFIADRVRRLYPPLLGLLIGGTAVVAVWPRGGVETGHVIDSAFIAASQAMAPVMASGGGAFREPFVITWSLAIEWYFYLLWPFAVRLLGRLSFRNASRVCAFAGVAMYLISLTSSPSWFYFGPLPRFAEMILGAALAFWSLAGNTAPSRRITPLAWAALSFIASWTLVGPDVYSWQYRVLAFPSVVAGTLILIALGNSASSGHPVRAILEWRPLVWVGGISYSLYLWHTFPIALIPGDWYGLPMPILGAIGLLLVAVLTYAGFVLLEKPFRHRRSRELRVGLAVQSPAER